jgi:hypothetical protein
MIKRWCRSISDVIGRNIYLHLSMRYADTSEGFKRRELGRVLDIRDPEAAVRNPVLRPYVGEVLEQTLDMIFNEA